MGVIGACQDGEGADGLGAGVPISDVKKAHLAHTYADLNGFQRGRIADLGRFRTSPPEFEFPLVANSGIQRFGDLRLLST